MVNNCDLYWTSVRKFKDVWDCIEIHFSASNTCHVKKTHGWKKQTATSWGMPRTAGSCCHPGLLAASRGPECCTVTLLPLTGSQSKVLQSFQFLPLSRFPGDTAFKSPNCKITDICAIVTTWQNKRTLYQSVVKTPLHDFLKVWTADHFDL